MYSLFGNGPRKSVATASQGPFANSVLFIGGGFAARETRVQSRQSFTNFSASMSIWGHHTLALNRRFIADSLGWLSCANVTTFCLRFDGITMRTPLNIIVPTVDSSCRNGYSLQVLFSANSDISIGVGTAFLIIKSMLCPPLIS